AAAVEVVGDRAGRGRRRAVTGAVVVGAYGPRGVGVVVVGADAVPERVVVERAGRDRRRPVARAVAVTVGHRRPERIVADLTAGVGRGPLARHVIVARQAVVEHRIDAGLVVAVAVDVEREIAGAGCGRRRAVDAELVGAALVPVTDDEAVRRQAVDE